MKYKKKIISVGKDTENIITNEEEYNIILRAYNRQINSYDRTNEELYDEIDRLEEERDEFIKKRKGVYWNTDRGLLKNRGGSIVNTF